MGRRTKSTKGRRTKKVGNHWYRYTAGVVYTSEPICYGN